MGQVLIRNLAALGLLTMPILPSSAQDTGGLQLTLGVEERLSVDRNLALDSPPEGTRVALDTILSFGLVSETRTQRLALDISASLQYERDEDEQTDFGISDPSARLSYNREGANSAFSASASYLRTRIEDVAISDDPDDPTDTTGGGDRADTTFETALELGTTAPLGFGLTASHDRTDYFNTTDIDLFDSETTNVEAIGRLRFSPVTTGLISLEVEQYRAEDPETTHIDTTAASFGVLQGISPSTRLEASLGYSRVETEEFGITTVEQGPTLDLGLTRDLPNGTADVSLESINDRNGSRITLDFGRAMELPAGSLSARLGVSRLEENDPNLIGSVNWLQTLPRGEFNARLSREAASTDDEVETVTTFLSLGLTRDINAVSNIGLGLVFAVVEETGENRVNRADLSARYTRNLTPEWDMNVGVNYRTRREESVDSASSESVFFSLSRSFDLRP